MCLAAQTIAALSARHLTCAACESLTGGLICAALVDVPGASAVVRGGLVTYQTDTKTLLAGVDAALIAEKGVVSEDVARAMAAGTRLRLGVDIAVSATGLAGPGGGTPDLPVGTVCIGVSTPRETRAVTLHLTGSRADIRHQAAEQAIRALYDAAMGFPLPHSSFRIGDVCS